MQKLVILTNDFDGVNNNTVITTLEYESAEAFVNDTVNKFIAGKLRTNRSGLLPYYEIACNLWLDEYAIRAFSTSNVCTLDQFFTKHITCLASTFQNEQD